MKRKGAYPITRGGRVEGFRQRGSKKASKKPVKQRIKRVVRPVMPKVPASIEVVFPSEGVGFFDAWDAEEFYSWADKAKKALAKVIPLREVEGLWRSIPSEETAVVDGERSPVIPYLDGETFIDDVEGAFKGKGSARLRAIEDHVWERCEMCSRRTHPNEIELYKGICADCAN